MKKVGEVSDWFRSSNTCQHRGRAFHFSPNEGKLVVTEAILGDEVELVRVQTGVECKATNYWYIACYPFGDRILVMAGEEKSVFVALVEVEDGRLSEETIHVTTLTVSGDKEWAWRPYLC